MPRCARVKSYDSVYHIMMQGISDVLLFRSCADKDMYLKTIKRYQEVFLFKIYAYCLLDTHVELLIDCNGADISKIMHSINQYYAQYYNRTHKRHGPLFEARFKSNIINKECALINVSAYINKIPGCIDGYEGKEENYKYSSFGIYLGIRNDEYNILDTLFMLNQLSHDIMRAKNQYLEIVREYDVNNQSIDMEFKSQRSEYRSEKYILVRNTTPDDVIDFVASYINQDKLKIKIKYIKNAVEIKALSALLMRCLCDMSQKLICSEMGNITQARVSKLCNIGLALIEEKSEFKNLIPDFLAERASRESC